MSTNNEILSKEEVSLSEALDIIGKKEGELTYREEKVQDFLKKNTKLEFAEFNKAKEAMIALDIPRMEDIHVIKILNIMPKTGTELRAIVSHDGLVLVDETAKKILDTIKQFA
jgi:DNA-directed RNA polymerase subunit F